MRVQLKLSENFLARQAHRVYSLVSGLMIFPCKVQSQRTLVAETRSFYLNPFIADKLCILILSRLYTYQTGRQKVPKI
jgi:hypothetical protein